MIYFIKSETLGLIKIGYCWEGGLVSRYKDLNTSSPDKLTILGFIRNKSIKDEQELHYQFKYLRVRGEWFSNGEALIEYIEENAIKYIKEKTKKEEITELKQAVGDSFNRIKNENRYPLLSFKSSIRRLNKLN